MEFVLFVGIGSGAGWLAGQFTKGGGFGRAGDIAVGILGALAGGLLLSLTVPAGKEIMTGALIAAFGAIAALVLVRIFKKVPLPHPKAPWKRRRHRS